jgi:pyruvate dehydrogenase E2 component (dihydrolipoamide acetyltransferase)
VATEVVVPMLGVTVETGIIVEWLKSEGEHVDKGESLFVVEADKVTTEVESPASGILAKILLPVGQKVPVLTVVAVITEPGETVPEKYLVPIDVKPLTQASEHHQPSLPSSISVILSSSVSDGPIRAVPAARKLAKEKELELSRLKGTGPGGVILHKDVEAALDIAERPLRKVSTLARRYAAQKGVSLAETEGSGVRGRVMRADVAKSVEEAALPQLGKIIPMGTMRQVIARRMSESAFTAPHIYFFSDIQMDPLLNFRRSIQPGFENTIGLRLSINDLLIKAVALTILEWPILNATIKDGEIHVLPEVNICLAVALQDGLITPAIANADKVGLADIVRQRTDLVRRARSGNLTTEELECGTFTISSLAQYDIIQFTAIINPPQCGILSVGKTRDSLYLENDGRVKTNRIATFGISVDHRIIDGVIAAEFLQNLKSKLERPEFTFLHL